MIRNLLLLMGFCYLSITMTQAQSFVNAAATGLNDGSSWENAFTNLDSALAKTTEGELWIAAGIYRHDGVSPDSFRTFFISSDIDLYGGFNGTESTVDERDIENNTTLLTADFNGDDITSRFDTLKTDNSYHVITVDSFILSPVIFDGLTIAGGNTNNDVELSQYNRRGAGIYSWSTIEVNQCTFTGNYANAGASIFLDPGKGGGNSSKITNSIFTENQASSRGAGVYFFNLSDILIQGNSFTQNVTSRGCVYPFRSDNIMIIDNIFDENVGISADVFCTGVYDFQSTRVTIENCEFTNGISANATSIYFDADSSHSAFTDNLTVRNCLFDNNTATGYGGNGIYLWQGIGVLVENCTFSNNISPNASSIYQDGRQQVIAQNNVIIRDCIFQDNTATSFGGGAMLTFQASTTFENCLFEGNSGPNGGSLYLGGDRGKEVIISDCEFKNNEASEYGQLNLYGNNANFLVKNSVFEGNKVVNGGGALTNGFRANSVIDSCSFIDNEAGRGAIFVQNDSTQVHVSNSFFSGNKAETNGGGLYQLNGSFVTVDNCEFVSNSSVNGAGINSVAGDTEIEGELIVSNTKISFNSATGQGGGLNIIDTDATISNCLINNNFNLNGISGGGISGNTGDSSSITINIVNSTIAENEGPVGAGIGLYTGTSESFLNLTLQNTILANVGANYQIEDGTPQIVSLGGNVSSDASLDGIFDPGLGDLTEVESQLFVDVDESDFHLVAGSPAINIGTLPAPEFDIEGNPRVDAPDAGAYEAQADVNVEELVRNNRQLKVVPNPVSEILNVHMDNSWKGNLNLKIYSRNGQLVKNWSSFKNTNELSEKVNVTGLPPGTYGLMVGDGEKVVVTSFIKIK